RTTFSVAVVSGRAAVPLWWRTVAGDARSLRASRRGWIDATVDLSAYVGRTVDLVLSAAFAEREGLCLPAWSRPVVRSVGTEMGADSRPLVSRRLVQDLLGDAAPPIDLGSFVAYHRLLQAPVVAALGTGPPRPGQNGPLEVACDAAAHAELELSGEVLRGPRTRDRAGAPVVFEARLDGAPAVTEPVDPLAAPVTFTRSVALAGRAGQRCRLDLGTRGAGEGTVAWWTSAGVWARAPVTRQLAREGRNLLLVVVDTLRADRLRLYGGVRDTAPNLDWLSRESLVFDRAFAPCSWTQPSVATILTGLSPIQHGVIGGVALPPWVETLAEVLQRRGLTSLAVSSNPVIGRREGFERGFETFVQVPWARADEVSAVFEDWLQEHHDLRWFAYVHYIDPHDSYDAPVPPQLSFTSGLRPLGRDKSWRRLHEADFGRVTLRLERADLDYLRAAYDDEVRFWDAGFGRLLDALRRAHVLDDTIVAVVGDHGEEFMEHGNLFHGCHLYDETIHVPLLIHAPGLVAPGRQAELFDLGSLKPLLTGLSSGRSLDLGILRHPSPLFSHTAMALTRDHFQTLVAVRDAHAKYLLRLDDGSAELYDLDRDPGEKTNLATQQVSAASAHRAQLMSWVRSGAPTRRAWRDPDLLERMRALGYLR
ncbi:MAG TPA: sulfatase-like hydrolase/transferase, partial [Vicinamibacteria bacterium]|nr:sulfatase-like hydrolase/transferase [Vicinamibacteria bacterium]